MAYNKAAGADARECSLRSYVLGHYKSKRNEATGSARPVALRDASSWSVILTVFRNEGYDQAVTLAQVFWLKDPQGQPARLFVAAERALGVVQDFAGFGSDIAALRKKLRASGCELHDSFPPYGAWFRRRSGIEHEQALELFHQTVSMKSVGNLTYFVRSHMLEPFDVGSPIDALMHHFDDLDRAHQAVLRAKRQVELLAPLVEEGRRHAALVTQIQGWRDGRDALRPYFARLKGELLERRLTLLAEETAGSMPRSSGCTRSVTPSAARPPPWSARCATTAATACSSWPPRSAARTLNLNPAVHGRVKRKGASIHAGFQPISSTAEQFQIGDSRGGKKGARDNALPSDRHLQLPFLG